MYEEKLERVKEEEDEGEEQADHTPFCDMMDGGGKEA